MARIRAALQRSNSTSVPLVEQELPVPRPKAELPPVETAVEPMEEIPYIEVGGKDTPIDASPSVLAATPPPRLKIHLPEPEKPKLAVVTEPEASVLAPESEPDTLSFQSLQPNSASLKPAEQRLHPRLVAFHQPGHAVSQQYRLVGGHLAGQLPARKAQALLFTPVPASLDSATILLNLAISRVREAGTRIVLVDANAQKPTLAEALGLELSPGLLEVLSGGLSLQRVLQQTGIENLTALTAGQGAPESHLMVGGDGMRAVLRHLKDRFEWVLVHAPSWDGRPDVVSLGGACDAVYLVLPRAQAQAREIKELMQLIPIQGGKLRGCIYI